MVALPLVQLVVLAGLQSRAPADLHSPGVNLIAGDLSAVAGYVAPGLPAPLAERARVQGHLRFAHDVLARVDTSGWPTALRIARARNLDRLSVYAAAGQFPYNDDHPDAHRPTFVDRDGTLCAVGALFAADRGRASADRIAAAYKYAFIAHLSVDTSLSADPFVDRNVNLRWSTGLTGRLARVDGSGWFLHPALSLAVVRTLEGWSGNLLFDLAATGTPQRSYSYSEG